MIKKHSKYSLVTEGLEMRQSSSIIGKAALLSFDFDAIQIGKQWNIGEARESKMHRIHAYPAKFPAFITAKAVEYFKAATNKEPRYIADIFCGCGTTSLESKRFNTNFWGCDINPVATLIAKVKSGTYYAAKLQILFQSIRNEFDAKPEYEAWKMAPERLAYWYDEIHYNDLFRLKSAILSVAGGRRKYKNFFLCAFSNILKPTSKWLTKSIKPQIDPDKEPVCVWNAFEAQFNLMSDACNEEKENGKCKQKIITRNFLKISDGLPLIDLIVTSPPYVTSYEYADLHQLSSLWLGYANDYRELRKGSIGSSYHQDRKFCMTDIAVRLRGLTLRIYWIENSHVCA